MELDDSSHSLLSSSSSSEEEELPFSEEEDDEDHASSSYSSSSPLPSPLAASPTVTSLLDLCSTLTSSFSSSTAFDVDVDSDRPLDEDNHESQTGPETTATPELESRGAEDADADGVAGEPEVVLTEGETAFEERKAAVPEEPSAGVTALERGDSRFGVDRDLLIKELPPPITGLPKLKERKKSRSHHSTSKRSHHHRSNSASASVSGDDSHAAKKKKKMKEGKGDRHQDNKEREGERGKDKEKKKKKKRRKERPKTLRERSTKDEDLSTATEKPVRTRSVSSLVASAPSLSLACEKIMAGSSPSLPSPLSKERRKEHKHRSKRRDDATKKSASSDTLASKSSDQLAVTNASKISPLSSPSVSRIDGHKSQSTHCANAPALIANSSSATELDSLAAPPVEGTMEEAIAMFNGPSPKKAVEFLIKHKLVEGTADSMARFFHNYQDLTKEKIGEYLGERDDFALATLDRFVGLIDFSSLEFDKALRILLSKFRLPGESQKIERIVEAFSKHFYASNPGYPFESPDAPFILAYSVIMLNTDAHNPQVKNKMTVEQFIHNNRGINGGKDIDQKYLEDLYHRIVDEEIKTKDDDAFPDAIKKGWLQLEGKTNLLMKSKRIRRWFVLNNNHSLYQFRSPKEEAQSPVATFSMLQGITIERKEEDDGGKDGEWSFSLYETTTPEDCTEAVVSNSWKLIAPSVRVRDEWIGALGKNNTLVVTSVPPTVGIKMDEDEVEISHLHESAKNTSTCLSNLVHGLDTAIENQEDCIDPIKRLAFSFETSAATLKKEGKSHPASSATSPASSSTATALSPTSNSTLIQLLNSSANFLNAVEKLHSSLFQRMDGDVRKPLQEIILYDFNATKYEAQQFSDAKANFRAIDDELQKEIKEQSRKNAANPMKFQKLYKKHHDLDEELKEQRLRTTETLVDAKRTAESQLAQSTDSIVEIYSKFFSEGMQLVDQVTKQLSEIKGADSTGVSPCSPILRQGTLFKKSKSSNHWKSFTFILRKKYLFYVDESAKQQQAQLKGAVQLRNCTVEMVRTKSREHSFAILGPLRTFYFAAPSSMELEGWMAAISSCIVNSPTFKPRSLTAEGDPDSDFIEDALSKQKEIVVNKQKEIAKAKLRDRLGHQKSASTSSPTFVEDVRRASKLWGARGGDSTIVDTWDDIGPIVKEGTLSKRGEKVKNWKVRWFVLRQGYPYLKYYEGTTAQENTLKGTIDLRKASVEVSQAAFVKKKPHCFEIRCSYRTYFICAANPGEMRDWMEAVRTTIEEDARKFASAVLPPLQPVSRLSSPSLSSTSGLSPRSLSSSSSSSSPPNGNPPGGIAPLSPLSSSPGGGGSTAPSPRSSPRSNRSSPSTPPT